MAVFSGVVRSEILKNDTGLNIIFPHDREPCAKPKILFLLHGLGENHTAWLRYSNIESYARDRGYVVIMPDAGRSFYSNMAHGNDVFNYIADELPVLCSKMFGLEIERNNTFIAGLSMGGYGAMKIAMRRPKKFRACAGFSSCTDMEAAKNMVPEDEDPRIIDQWKGVFGNNLEVSPRQNLFKISENLMTLDEKQRPSIYFCCGQEDYLYTMNRGFKDHLEKLKIDFSYEEWPGNHNWVFWNEAVIKSLDFFDNLA